MSFVDVSFAAAGGAAVAGVFGFLGPPVRKTPGLSIPVNKIRRLSTKTKGQNFFFKSVHFLRQVKLKI